MDSKNLNFTDSINLKPPKNSGCELKGIKLTSTDAESIALATVLPQKELAKRLKTIPPSDAFFYSKSIKALINTKVGATPQNILETIKIENPDFVIEQLINNSHCLLNGEIYSGIEAQAICFILIGCIPQNFARFTTIQKEEAERLYGKVKYRSHIKNLHLLEKYPYLKNDSATWLTFIENGNIKFEVLCKLLAICISANDYMNLLSVSNKEYVFSKIDERLHLLCEELKRSSFRSYQHGRSKK